MESGMQIAYKLNFTSIEYLSSQEELRKSKPQNNNYATFLG